MPFGRTVSVKLGPSQVGPNKQEFTVDGLTPKKKYKFRVKAVNKEGESEPLENDEPILARNPYGECCPGSSSQAGGGGGHQVKTHNEVDKLRET